MANLNGRGFNKIDTTTGSDVLARLLSPIKDIETVIVSDVHPAVAGTIKILSDMLVIPYESYSSGVCLAALRIPQLRYRIINGSGLPAGQQLIYDSVSDAFVMPDPLQAPSEVTALSDVRITGQLLFTTNRAEQSVLSEAIIAFDGTGRIYNTASDAIARF